MRILVCGGRDFSNQGLLCEALGLCVDAYGLNFTIIEGDAKGADRMAGAWAEIHNKDLMVFPADWDKHGNSAGPIRNKQMLDEGRPDLVLAFPGGRGTDNMIKLSKAAGVPVVNIGASGWQTAILGDQKK